MKTEPCYWPLGLALAVGALLAAIAWPNASSSLAGFPAGDVSMFQRLAVVEAAAAMALFAFHARPTSAALDWLSVSLPAWVHLSAAPGWLTPVAFVALASALLRARTDRHMLLIAALSALTQIIGAAGWIFHYFASPLLPSVVAAAVAVVLWSPASWLAARLCRRSVLWLPLAALMWPATEWVRGTWMSPPLPGLFLVHASADSAFGALTVHVGEFGASYALAAFAFGAAALLDNGSVARKAASAIAVLGVCFASSSTPSSAPETRGTADTTTRVCAVQDPHRNDRRAAPFAGGGSAAINALFRSAVGLHRCDITILPEYSVEVSSAELVVAEVSRTRDAGPVPGPVLLGGAFSMTRDPKGRPEHVRNVVCQLHEYGNTFLCADPLDKLVFAPFGEAALFHDTPALASLGRWITKLATGKTFEGLTSRRTVGAVHSRRFSFGGSICWEILVPGIFDRRGITQESVSLLVVPSDLDGFGGSLEAIEQFRRAARIHAMRLHTPLVFASTHAAFLVTAAGNEAEPVYSDSFFRIWDVTLSR